MSEKRDVHQNGYHGYSERILMVDLYYVGFVWLAGFILLFMGGPAVFPIFSTMIMTMSTNSLKFLCFLSMFWCPVLI